MMSNPPPRPRAEMIPQIERALACHAYDEAVRLAQDLVDRDAGDAYAVALEAWCSARGGDAPEHDLRSALTKLDRAVALDRTSDEAFYYRGLAQKQLGNVMAAFRDFARAFQLNPQHVCAEREVRLLAMRARKA